MNNKTIQQIESKMRNHLDNEQMCLLHETLLQCIGSTDQTSEGEPSLLQSFLAAKRVEGCSDKTIKYYESTIRNVLSAISKDVKDIRTDDLRIYLDDYQSKSGAAKVTIDNIRRILSSFFSWLEDEDYILKSPVRRIHKVKICKTVKETYSDEALELMRDNSECSRDLAIIDLLSSTGMILISRTGNVSFSAKEINSVKYILMPEQKYIFRNICKTVPMTIALFSFHFKNQIKGC